MAKYSIDITESAQKEMDALNDPLFSRIDAKISVLEDDPRPSGCRKLKGYKDQWRIRVGDYRVIYIIDDIARVVTITRIAHRGEVYD